MTSLQQEMGMGLSFKRNPFKKIRLKDVSIKKAVKVYNDVQPLVSTAVAFVPGGGVASKFLDGKIGKIIGKVQNSGAGRFITKAAGTKVGQFVTKNGAPLLKSAFNTAKNDALGNQSGGSASEAPGADAEMQDQVTPANPNDAQQKTLDNLKDDGTPKKDNTLLYVGGGTVILLLGALAMKLNSN